MSAGRPCGRPCSAVLSVLGSARIGGARKRLTAATAWMRHCRQGGWRRHTSAAMHSPSVAVCARFPPLRRSTSIRHFLNSDDDDNSSDGVDEHDESGQQGQAMPHTTREEVLTRARELARDIGVPLVEPSPGSSVGRAARHVEFLVEVTPARVQLTQRDAAQPDRRLAPVYVDFVEGTLAHRAKYGDDRSSPMARAVGISGKDHGLSVLDATGGLGKDAFVLANLGCKVTIVERHPVVHALLQDGLKRLNEVQKDTSVSLRLVHADSMYYLPLIPESQKPDVIYIDPMYPQPERKRKALTKIGMQLARSLIGDDTDAKQLLEIARKVARRWVVVKRPTYASEDPRAARVYRSPNTRFEVYNANSKPEETDVI